MESSRAKFELTILISILAIIMLATANLWGVVETSEARYAEISREMVRSGDWLHPTLLKIHHYHKPPVTYWLTAVAYSIFGVNAFATRFFLLITYCIQVLLVYKLGKILFRNELTAYYSAVVYGTLPLVLISVRGLTTDAYLNLFVLLSLYWWVKFLKTQTPFFFYLTCLSLGLGFTTKGPVIFIVPLFAAAGTWTLLPRPRLNIVHVLTGLSIFVAVGFWWFGYLIREDGSFADYFVFHHLVDRVAHAEVFSRKEPWFYYLPIVPLVTLPWIVTFLKQIFSRGIQNDDEPMSKRIFVWWFLVPLLLFSVASSKLVLYILPLSTGFSLVAGHGVSKFNRVSQISYVVLAGLVYVILIVIPFFIPQINMNATFIFVPAVCLLVSVAMCFLNNYLPRLVTVVSGLFAANLLIYSSLLFHYNSREANTVTQVATFIKQNNLQDRQIVVYNELLPSLSFELDRDIVSVYAGNRSLQREVQFEQTTLWQASLVDTTTDPGVEALQHLLKNKSVIVTKADSSPLLRAMMAGDWKKQNIGKWTIYYN
jgi:4-amino-4-deoxy-L-arabinose transferase-like glycosyltransferase